jgi:M6 family metalloprotease-like protein
MIKALAVAAAAAFALSAGFLSASVAPAAHVRDTGGCAAARAAASAYARSIPAARRAYFKRHRKAADRARFTRAQAKRLAALRRAATRACTTTTTTATTTTTTVTTTTTTPPTPTGCSPTLAAGPFQSEGGTVDPFFHPAAKGELKAVMLFVDFPDAATNETTQSLYDLLAPGAQWYADASYGRMTLAITPVHTWYRMPKASTDYGFARGLTFETQKAYITDAVHAADATVDFSQYQIVYVVSDRNPGITFSPAYHAGKGSGILVDGTELRWGVTFGNDIRSARWGSHVLVHETGHVLGLPDLYDANFDASDYHAQFKFVGGWSVMSWVEPGGQFFAWEKWHLGWLDPSQIRCVDAKTTLEATVTPLEAAGGVKMIVAKTSDSTAYVVEVRKPNASESFCDEGVLVYTVDSTIASARGPVQVKTAHTGADAAKVALCSRLYDATLHAGQPYEDTAVKVEALSAQADGSYTVRISLK